MQTVVVVVVVTVYQRYFDITTHRTLQQSKTTTIEKFSIEPPCHVTISAQQHLNVYDSWKCLIIQINQCININKVFSSFWKILQICEVGFSGILYFKDFHCVIIQYNMIRCVHLSFKMNNVLIYKVFWHFIFGQMIKYKYKCE